MEDKELQELEEFTLEDIIREFGASAEEDAPQEIAETTDEEIKKAYNEVKEGRYGFNLTEQIDNKKCAYFHDYIYHKAKEIRFVKGRLKFGQSKNAAPFPSMVVVF